MALERSRKAFPSQSSALLFSWRPVYQSKVAEKLQQSQSEQVPPSPSLLSRVKQYWKLNLPKAYSRMSPKDFRRR